MGDPPTSDRATTDPATTDPATRATVQPGAPQPDAVRLAARRILADQWREPGFTCPNASTYPWLWLWDSCFHSVVWAELGDADRAVAELSNALGAQNDDGFVPHLQYLDRSTDHAAFWGRPPVPIVSSSITQPPIHGWTVSELVRRGVEVPSDVVDRSAAGLRFLIERRRRSPAGLIELVHPWESGCDHSPRWDDLMSAPPGGAGDGRRADGDPYDERQWFVRKGDLLDTVRRSAAGSPLWNDEFAVGSVAMTAMTGFCATELASVTGDRSLADAADDLADAVARRWDDGRRTYVDDGPTSHGSGRIRTAEALLGLLVDHRPEVADAIAEELTDPDAFGGPFGPTQVHRDEPTYRRNSYWRGPSWPQLDLLLWIALGRAGTPASADAAAEVARATVDGAVGSGWAEYWDSDDARPGGAAPQSWTTVAICMR